MRQRAIKRYLRDPYRNFMKPDGGPSVVLSYLLDYAVDGQALTFGYGTDGNARGGFGALISMPAASRVTTTCFCRSIKPAISSAIVGSDTSALASARVYVVQAYQSGRLSRPS